MIDIEHPSITRANKTGYPNKEGQVEHFGTDIFDHEILTGDTYLLLPNGELLHENNIEDYLNEIIGCIYKKAD